MNKEKLYLDSRYFETIVRATGLINSDKRVIRVKEISNFNILLACTCKSTSIEEEADLTKHLIKKCKDQIRFYSKFQKAYDGILSLTILEEFEEVAKLFLKMNLFDKVQARVLRKIIAKLETDKVFIILRIILEKAKDEFLAKYVISLLTRKSEHRLPQDLELVNEVTNYLLSSSNVEYLNLGFKWVNKYNIERISKESIIARMLKRINRRDFSRIDHVLKLVHENKLEEQHSVKISSILKGLLSKNTPRAKGFTNYIIKKYKLKNPNVKIGSTYDCEVLNVIPSRVFVKILKHPTTSSSIYIGEVSDDRIENLADIYERGQIIKAKVIEVDKIKGVNLTIKGIKSAPNRVGGSAQSKL